MAWRLTCTLWDVYYTLCLRDLNRGKIEMNSLSLIFFLISRIRFVCCLYLPLKRERELIRIFNFRLLELEENAVKLIEDLTDPDLNHRIKLESKSFYWYYLMFIHVVDVKRSPFMMDVNGRSRTDRPTRYTYIIYTTINHILCYSIVFQHS